MCHTPEASFPVKDLMTFVRGTAESALPRAARQRKVGPTNCENQGAFSPRSIELPKICDVNLKLRQGEEI